MGLEQREPVRHALGKVGPGEDPSVEEVDLERSRVVRGGERVRGGQGLGRGEGVGVSEGVGVEQRSQRVKGRAVDGQESGWALGGGRSSDGGLLGAETN